MNEPIIEAGPNEPHKKSVSPGLKFALEIGPLLIFFFVTMKGEWLASVFPALRVFGKPLLIATALFMAATMIALAISWVKTRTLPLMPLVSAAVVLVFGGLSIWLQNDMFIKMKPTIIYTLFGALLLGGLWFNKALLGYVFDQAFTLDDAGWRKLSFRWGVFFICCAVLNEILWRSLAVMYPAELADKYWSGFKLFGFTGLTMVFVISQMPLILRHSLDDNLRKPGGEK